MITAREAWEKKDPYFTLAFLKCVVLSQLPQVSDGTRFHCLLAQTNAAGSQAQQAVVEATSEITVYMVFLTIIIRVSLSFYIPTGRKKGSRELRNLKFLDFRAA